MVDKYVDHLPLYRQRQRFLRENIPIALSTLDGWAAQAMDRLAQSLPIINELSDWINRQLTQVLPKSQIGKALAYSAKRWDALSGYLYDGVLEIDNNLVENTIRPLALGRKNYLFAGSHKAAQRAAMVYSLLGTCKLHGVNPTQWLAHVLANILQTKYDDVKMLYPQNCKDKFKM